MSAQDRVTVDTTADAKGGLNLKVAGIGGFEAGGGKTDRESVVSRIKFQVPIQLPKSEDESPNK